MSAGDIQWSTRGEVVRVLVARLSAAEEHDALFQRVLATATELADPETLTRLYRRYLSVATTQVADLLRLACAVRAAPLENDERRGAVRAAVQRIDEDLAKPSPHQRWNNIAGRTCVYFLAACDPTTVSGILADELERDSSIYASLWVSATNLLPDELPLAQALIRAWASAAHKPHWHDTYIGMARFRLHPGADHSRLRGLYPKLLSLPKDNALLPEEVRELFADDTQAMNDLLNRIENERKMQKRIANPKARTKVTGIRAALARAVASARNGDEAGIATLIELARHESRHTRSSALRSLVCCDAGYEVFRENARSSVGYQDVRLALHGLARSTDPADHDLLLASVLNRNDGTTHLACLAALAGAAALDPDAYVDSFANDALLEPPK